MHIARASDIGQLTPRLSEDIVKLIDNFWPGPLTIVVKKKDTISRTVSGGLDTVAVRLPDSEATRALINWAGTPIVGPSANTSGKPSPTKAEHVDCGDYVIVINAEKVAVTGKKRHDKKYVRFTGYPGGLRETSFEEMMEKHPEEAVRHAVKGMK